LSNSFSLLLSYSSEAALAPLASSSYFYLSSIFFACSLISSLAATISSSYY